MGNFVDRAIGVFAPGWAAKRSQARAAGNILASYGGAVQTRVDNSWGVTQYALQQNAPYYSELWRMRDRARQLEKNNLIADGLLSRAVDNVVGEHGFQLKVTTADPDWNDKAEALMRDWFDSADVRGIGWLEHQQLVLRSFLRDGDVGAVLLLDGRVQLVEGDLIANQKATDPYTVQGITVNKVGRPLTFWVTTYDTYGGIDSITPVDAENFVFFARRKRVLQLRGEPVFAQSFTLFDQIDQWQEAVLVKERMAACFGIAITKNNPGDFAGNIANSTTNVVGQKQRTISFEPGMVPVLEPGESIEPIAPSQSAQSFPDTLKAMSRLLGLPLGLPLEYVLLDFTTGSYSAAKASLETAKTSFKVLRRRMMNDYLSRIYRWRISKFIKEGKLAPRSDAWSHHWIGAPWPYLDQMKEAQATQVCIDVGTMTLGEALAQQGKDLDTHIQHRSDELKKLKAAGIPIYRNSSSLPFNQGAQPDGAAPAADAATALADDTTDTNEGDTTDE